MAALMKTKLIKILMTFALLFACLPLPSTAAESYEDITLEELKQLPAFPDEYMVLSYYARIDWLNTKIAQDNDATMDYHLKRELAFQHFSQYKNNQAFEVCQYNPPLHFDLRYRYLCIASNNSGYEEPISQFLELYDDAMEAENKEVAAHTLTAMGWMQSINGDIAQAFQTYELALTLGEDINFFSLTDIMINTATLYTVYGDNEYIHKGLQLHKETLEKLRQKKEEEPENAQLIDTNIEVVTYNLGNAYALHLGEYEQALEWFDKMDTNLTGLEKSRLVFSALAAAELNKAGLARNYLNQSYRVSSSDRVDTEYLKCYQQLVEVKLGQQNTLKMCNNLNEQTPLESELDIYKRIARLDAPELRYDGLVNLYKLFVEKLEPQLKHSSSRAASTAELNRLQQESRLKSELLEKELALKASEEAKREGQVRLAIALALILLLLIVIISVRLSQKRKLAQQYEAMSVLDVLTGLNNRRFFELNIERELNFVKRVKDDGSQQTIAMYLIDIDYFKKVNDQYGHEAGDQVLVEFAERIKQTIRETDIFVRWGGEEFLLVTRLEHSDDHKCVAERISKAINQTPFSILGNTNINITCTIGSIIYPYAKENGLQTRWNKLVQLADAALYYGKRKQRNCWVCIEKILDKKWIEDILSKDLEYVIEEKLVTVSSSCNGSS